MTKHEDFPSMHWVKHFHDILELNPFFASGDFCRLLITFANMFDTLIVLLKEIFLKS